MENQRLRSSDDTVFVAQLSRVRN